MNKSLIITACLAYNIALFSLAFLVVAVYDWSIWTFVVPFAVGVGKEDIESFVGLAED